MSKIDILTDSQFLRAYEGERVHNEYYITINGKFTDFTFLYELVNELYTRSPLYINKQYKAGASPFQSLMERNEFPEEYYRKKGASDYAAGVLKNTIVDYKLLSDPLKMTLRSDMRNVVFSKRGDEAIRKGIVVNALGTFPEGSNVEQYGNSVVILFDRFFEEDSIDDTLCNLYLLKPVFTTPTSFSVKLFPIEHPTSERSGTLDAIMKQFEQV